VKNHSVRVWGTENPRKVLTYEGAIEKVVFAAKSCKYVYGPFLFAELTVTRIVYQDVPELPHSTT
jgi:hypothetical protein